MWFEWIWSGQRSSRRPRSALISTLVSVFDIERTPLAHLEKKKMPRKCCDGSGNERLVGKNYSACMPKQTGKLPECGRFNKQLRTFPPGNHPAPHSLPCLQDRSTRNYDHHLEVSYTACSSCKSCCMIYIANSLLIIVAAVAISLSSITMDWTSTSYVVAGIVVAFLVFVSRPLTFYMQSA